MAYLQDLIEGKTDFYGQKQADDIVRIVLIGSSVSTTQPLESLSVNRQQVLSFVLGFALGSLRVTLGAFSLSTVVLSLVRATEHPCARRCSQTSSNRQVVLPPWSMYNKHPVKWLPSQEISSKTT
ncbi:hypothetical protein BS17DRAFT_779037 [Gyrodon lividus]|nr:hypothetical protein BS17DRAFT_779037 [Gyrodon lividus]